MKYTKIVKMIDGTRFSIIDSEAEAIFKSKTDMIYIKRLDQYLNKKYISSIVKHPDMDYKFVN